MGCFRPMHFLFAQNSEERGYITMVKDENRIREEVLAEIREANRRYKAEWRKKNPDKVRASNERYWLKKAEEMKQQGVN